MDNWWDSDSTVSSQPTSAPRIGAPLIRIPEKAPSPTDVRNEATMPYDVRKSAADATKAEIDAAEAARKAEAEREKTEGKDIELASMELLNALRAAQKAKKLSKEGLFATGFGSETAAKISGTAAADVQGLLNTVGAKAAFDRLQRMREESPTGGALGGIAVKELELLRDSVASLDPKQSDEQFQAQMDQIIESYSELYRKLGADPAKLENTLNQAGGGGEVDPVLREKYPQAENFVFAGGQLVGYEDKDGAFTLLFDTPKPPDGSGGGTSPGVPTRSTDGSILETIDAGVRGAADVLTLGLADEIAAAGDTLFSGGTMAENLAKQRGTDRFDEENNFGARLTGQVAGGFLLPASASTSVARNAGVAGAYGAGYGFGSTDGGFVDRLGGAAKTGLVSAGAGAGLTAVANRLARPKAGGIADDFLDETPMPTPLETYQAGQRIGANPLPADVGGPTTRLLSAATAATPGGVNPMVRGAEKLQDALQLTRDRVARMFAKPEEAEAAGEAAKAGALKWRKDSRDGIGRIYSKASTMAGDVAIQPTKALESLDANIAELSAVPGSSGLVSTMQGLKDEIAKLGTLSVDGVRGMRTVMRDRFMKEGLVGSDTERRINQVIDAASEDMAEGLLKSGNAEAAALFREADNFWKQRAQNMNEVIMPIIGKRGEKSGEQVFKALQSAATGNNTKFVQFMKSLPDEDKNIVTASIVDKLGKADDYGGFSLDRFLTDYGKMGKTAKQALFTPQQRAQLDDLATVARGSKAGKAFLNRSNTGLTMTTAGTATLALDSIFTLGGALGAQYGAGKLLTSPAVAKVLAKFGRAKTPQARANIISDLTTVAQRQPQIANEVLRLQESLVRSLAQSPGRAAASEDVDNRR